MTSSGSDNDNHDDPVTPDELKIVKSGKGTPAQIARVHAALDDPDSPISKWLKESEEWARKAFAWRHEAAPEGPAVLGLTTAHDNYFAVMEYVRHKQKAGVFTDDDIKAIVDATRGDDLSDPEPTPWHYAISVTRIIRTICKRHPELASEARALPISSPRTEPNR